MSILTTPSVFIFSTIHVHYLIIPHLCLLFIFIISAIFIYLHYFTILFYLYYFTSLFYLQYFISLYLSSLFMFTMLWDFIHLHCLFRFIQRFFLFIFTISSIFILSSLAIVWVFPLSQSFLSVGGTLYLLTHSCIYILSAQLCGIYRFPNLYASLLFLYRSLFLSLRSPPINMYTMLLCSSWIYSLCDQVFRHL